MLYKIFTLIGSTVSIAFGVWHFFVPKVWHWYSYIETGAKELVLAVRAINIFFSLSLVLIGLMNIILILDRQTSRHTLVVLLSVNIIFWLTRVILQIVMPQGTMNFFLQYGMLSAFLLVTALFIASVVLILCNT